ncbi:hypothetical protein PTTG_27525 [Puccinia triticina 1-1 BBBD Race 1]|uniref:OTU domain-containing protein n=1 Tax=Puccinia triticina (isolate 1-1 / race 1 (BBBD)) TaxID=630390 RepID=A0A180GL87_PUCT1|nr:hypothetical protein PTTG_27525 [Puccinia triticina 1-1 BBBD Race 1]
MTQPPKKKICLKTDASTSQSHQLVQHLPDFIQEYVARVQDVNSDGHCGFRAAAYCLGDKNIGLSQIQEDLVHEIKKQKTFYSKIGHYYDSDNVNQCLARIDTPEVGMVKENHWMSMPFTGKLLANTYNRPVFYFSTQGSSSFLPHFSSPNNSLPIFIGFIPDQQHFVALDLKDPMNLPFPRSTDIRGGKKNADPKAYG